MVSGLEISPLSILVYAALTTGGGSGLNSPDREGYIQQESQKALVVRQYRAKTVQMRALLEHQEWSRVNEKVALCIALADNQKANAIEYMKDCRAHAKYEAPSVSARLDSKVRIWRKNYPMTQFKRADQLDAIDLQKVIYEINSQFEQEKVPSVLTAQNSKSIPTKVSTFSQKTGPWGEGFNATDASQRNLPAQNAQPSVDPLSGLYREAVSPDAAIAMGAKGTEPVEYQSYNSPTQIERQQEKTFWTQKGERLSQIFNNVKHSWSELVK